MQAVLLDLFDTLVGCDWRAWHRDWARRMGTRPERLSEALRTTRLARNTGRYPDEATAMRAVAEACGLQPSGEAIDRLVAWASDTFPQRITVFDDVVPSLDRLRQEGTRIVLVSNCSRSARPVAESLADQLDALILSFEVRAAKPDPAIYRMALDAAGTAPDSAIFIDDQTTYLDGAARLGIGTFLIDRYGEDPDPGVHPTISSLWDLFGLAS